jgi:VanZ family protein
MFGRQAEKMVGVGGETATAAGRPFVFYYLLPVVIYCLGIFFLSSRADLGSMVPSAWMPNDKVVHLVLYAGLGLLTYRCFQRRFPGWNPTVVLLAATAFCIAYGGSDELHQSLVPGRESSWLDLLADGTGGYAGARLWMLVRRHL